MFKDFNKVLNYSNDLINVFTDYAFSLDNYFKVEKNKKEHEYLYNEYLILSKNLKEILNKYEVLKK